MIKTLKNLRFPYLFLKIICPSHVIWNYQMYLINGWIIKVFNELPITVRIALSNFDNCSGPSLFFCRAIYYFTLYYVSQLDFDSPTEYTWLWAYFFIVLNFYDQNTPPFYLIFTNLLFTRILFSTEHLIYTFTRIFQI